MASPRLKLIQPESPNAVENLGSYYIRDQRGTSWALYHRVFVDKKPVSTRVETLAYKDLGFRLDMTLEEAKKRCTLLNKENGLSKKTIRKAAANLKEIESLDKVLFPPEYISGFDQLLDRENLGSQLQLQKVRTHFTLAQKIITRLKLLPQHYGENAKSIYNELARQRVSYDYSLKIISLLNRYSRFVGRKQGMYVDEIPRPRDIARQRIVEAHENKEGVRGVTTALTPDVLKKKKDALRDEYYNWLFISVWFGLRPSDYEGLKKPFTLIGEDKTVFLKVYQKKLTSLPKDKRYKYIPIVEPEQKKALTMIESENYKRPTYKAIRDVFGEGYGAYSGRKGFVDLMLQLGYLLEEVSLWMGHTTIETTWTHYKEKNTLKLPTPKKRS